MNRLINTVQIFSALADGLIKKKSFLTFKQNYRQAAPLGVPNSMLLDVQANAAKVSN